MFTHSKHGILSTKLHSTKSVYENNKRLFFFLAFLCSAANGYEEKRTEGKQQDGKTRLFLRLATVQVSFISQFCEDYVSSLLAFFDVCEETAALYHNNSQLQFISSCCLRWCTLFCFSIAYLVIFSFCFNFGCWSVLWDFFFFYFTQFSVDIYGMPSF